MPSPDSNQAPPKVIAYVAIDKKSSFFKYALTKKDFDYLVNNEINKDDGSYFFLELREDDNNTCGWKANGYFKNKTFIYKNQPNDKIGQVYYISSKNLDKTRKHQTVAEALLKYRKNIIVIFYSKTNIENNEANSIVSIRHNCSRKSLAEISTPFTSTISAPPEFSALQKFLSFWSKQSGLLKAIVIGVSVLAGISLAITGLTLVYKFAKSPKALAENLSQTVNNQTSIIINPLAKVGHLFGLTKSVGQARGI